MIMDQHWARSGSSTMAPDIRFMPHKQTITKVQNTLREEPIKLT